jgi:hypothetical protein
MTGFTVCHHNPRCDFGTSFSSSVALAESSEVVGQQRSPELVEVGMGEDEMLAPWHRDV